MTKIARQKNVHKIKYTIIIEFYGVIGLSLNTVRLYNEMRVSAGCQSVSALCSRSRGSYISRLVDWLPRTSQTTVAFCQTLVVAPLASTPPGMPGTHPPQYFGWWGRQREYPPPNIITYFRI